MVFLKTGKWHSRGRRLRTLAELFSEDRADRWRAALERPLLAFFRTSAGLGLYFGGLALISLAVQIFLGLLMAFYFNRLSWISPAANLVVVPLSSLVLGAAILSQVASTGIPGFSTLNTIAGEGGTILFEVNRWLAAQPFASQRCPTPSLFLVCGSLVLLFAWCVFTWRRVWIPCAAVALSLLWLAGILEPVRNSSPLAFFATHSRGDQASGDLRLTFLDVGQGDSIVIRFPGGSVWVFDAGGVRDSSQDDMHPPVFDTGEAIVSRYLWHYRIRRIDRVLLSHPHQDHAGGLPALMKNFPVNELDYGPTVEDATLSRLLAVARELKVPSRAIHAGEQFSVGAVRVQALNPLRDGTIRSINDNSLVLRMSYGRFSALLTGDLEAAGESEVAGRTPEIRSLLLKVAHHGSRSATQEFFLNRARPRWAVISAGRNNPFGHPSRDAILRLIRHGARPLITSDEGAITLETDGNRYSLSSHVSGILETGILPNAVPAN
jgi:competence protein ComEC